jgi:hypothetical protein
MKNKLPWSTLELVILMVFSSILTTSVVMIASHAYIVSPLKKEAVERGYAEWEVTNNSSGQTKFVWKDKQLLTFSF